MTRAELVDQIRSALDERLIVEDPPTIEGVAAVTLDTTGNVVIVEADDGRAWAVIVVARGATE